MGARYKGGVSSVHLAVNRNQKSIAVDLKAKQGQEFIQRLLKTTDILVQNYRPGALEKFGLDYDSLKGKYPKLIYCEMTGYGSSGPHRDMTGHDVIAQGVSGLASLSGRGDQSPIIMGASIVDTTGALLATYGILAAYIDLLKTGKGHKIDSCLLNAGMALQVEGFAAYFNKGYLYPKVNTGGMSRHNNLPWGVYQTKDGYLVVSRIWMPVIREIFDDPRAKDIGDNDQVAKRTEIDDIICSEFKKKTTAEWEKILTEKKCWFTRIKEYDEIVNDPQVIHNGLIKEYEHPIAGKVKVLGNPVQFDGESLPIRHYAPLLGQNTVELMKECGYTQAEIDCHLANNVVVASSLPG
jgi:crotonobetainyl-CoA:carnitine CoA-transferase CaiB-like acyl-CoA transferase